MCVGLRRVQFCVVGCRRPCLKSWMHRKFVASSPLGPRDAGQRPNGFELRAREMARQLC